MSGSVGLGLGLVLLGGLLQGSFALPMKRMPAWRWENTWLVYSVAGMIVVPWALVWATVPRFSDVFARTPGATLLAVALFGFGWVSLPPPSWPRFFLSRGHSDSI